MMTQVYDLAVIGGGPAGMAAALEAERRGVGRIIIIERDACLGGVLNQCVHDGFGLVEFGSSLTGPEYAGRFRNMVLDSEVIHARVDTSVITIRRDKTFYLTLSDTVRGFCEICAKSVILAAGCREKTLGQLRIPGTRPAGIYTAGCTQYMMNIQNYLPGRSAVILGSGDIGLIMARRLTLEGAKVKMILGEKASGLVRNYIQCVRDFEIPICFGYTVLSVHGYSRLKGVTIAPLDDIGNPIAEKKQYIQCDLLLVAAGIIPEAELWRQLDMPLSSYMGVPADGEMRTPQPGLFVCGNVIKVCDTADEVSEQGRKAGASAAAWLGYSRGAKECKEVKTFITGQKLDGSVLSDISDILICSDCPKGCSLHVSNVDNELRVQGNECRNGLEFAIREMETPQRVLTTTVRVSQGDKKLVGVRTSRPIPKKLLFSAMKLCRRTVLRAPVSVGTVVLRDILDTGADIITTGEAQVFDKL